jgi:hypothetical protein
MALLRLQEREGQASGERDLVSELLVYKRRPDFSVVISSVTHSNQHKQHEVSGKPAISHQICYSIIRCIYFKFFFHFDMSLCNKIMKPG